MYIPISLCVLSICILCSVRQALYNVGAEMQSGRFIPWHMNQTWKRAVLGTDIQYL